MDRLKNIKFDWTFNIGHVFSVIGFLIAAGGVWMQLDKRVVILEVNDVNNAAVHKRIEKDVDEVKRTQREDVKQINDKLDKLLYMLSHK